MSQGIFSTGMNPLDGFSNASEGMELSGREKGSRQAEQASLLHVLYIGCPQKVWPRLKMNLPISNDLMKNNPSQVYSAV